MKLSGRPQAPHKHRGRPVHGLVDEALPGHQRCSKIRTNPLGATRQQLSSTIFSASRQSIAPRSGRTPNHSLERRDEYRRGLARPPGPKLPRLSAWHVTKEVDQRVEGCVGPAARRPSRRFCRRFASAQRVLLRQSPARSLGIGIIALTKTSSATATCMQRRGAVRPASDCATSTHRRARDRHALPPAPGTRTKVTPGTGVAVPANDR